MGPGNEPEGGNELAARRAEQFPHLGNYTLTSARVWDVHIRTSHLRAAWEIVFDRICSSATEWFIKYRRTTL